MNSESLAAALLESEGYAAFEYLGDRVFQAVGISPGFYRELPGGMETAEEAIRLTESMPFLDNFLVDAEEFWDSGAEGRVESGRWIEETAGGREMALEAFAFRLAGKRILVIRNPQQRYGQEVRVLQSARDAALEHEKLLSEIQKKEILLHCIIHDLSQPLSAMRGCFSLLAAEKFPAKLQGLVEIGERQSQVQEEMIRGILQAFSSELAAQDSIQRGAASGCDLAAIAHEVVKDYSAAFAAQGAAIRMEPKVDATRKWPVAGDESRLRRIYTNLVENALRYSPAGSTVTLGVTAEGNFLRATVDDEGLGASGRRDCGAFVRAVCERQGRGRKSGPRTLFLQDHGRTLGRNDRMREPAGKRNAILVPAAPSEGGKQAKREKHWRTEERGEICSRAGGKERRKCCEWRADAKSTEAAADSGGRGQSSKPEIDGFAAGETRAPGDGC